MALDHAPKMPLGILSTKLMNLLEFIEHHADRLLAVRSERVDGIQCVATDARKQR